MRARMPIVLLVLALVFDAARPALAEASRRPPNILLIVPDEQRPDTIGALGNDRIRTPNLDRLVKQGTAFTRAVAANPICTPSRAELISGCTGFRNGVNYFGNRLSPDLTLLAAGHAGRRLSHVVCGQMAPGRQTWGTWLRSRRRPLSGRQPAAADPAERLCRPPSDRRPRLVLSNRCWRRTTGIGRRADRRHQ